jgi:hypothetical protein
VLGLEPEIGAWTGRLRKTNAEVQLWHSGWGAEL